MLPALRVVTFINKGSKQSSSLWSKYSMLRSTIKLKGVDISQFASRIPYLKRQEDGYKAKKSLTLTHKNIEDFLIKSDNAHHLLNKVILLFGVFGACRRQELATLLTINVRLW
ncbi:hypothetical protein NQ315_003546 [Exocentrus adspersus]|uniref:Uncharacterized protein n=1 Tax=Exocentrus adspersus TaxID=1586481 RepID=A0AAV8VCT5_9CUCU|nr:hypothetical protein NQ315_003546 [Exocentrus adspersus]